ncbi:MAG: phosphatidate cytidylyltransferase [Richelia sp. RM2_1_2]|nr:phosphatidate cytidylyltransferase [Richelia sp. RM2_1_2]
MSENLINLFFLSIAFSVLFVIAELVYHIGKVNAETTRKFVHVGTGLLTISFPLLFTHYIWVVLICSAFLAVLFLSLKFGLLPSINAIPRKSYGTLCYPIIVSLAFIFYYFKKTNLTHDHFFFLIPILTMALADPIAALCGRNFPIGKYKVGEGQKTLVGSFSFFTVAWSVTALLLPHPNLFFLVLIPLVATLAEACSSKGLDNFTIPIAVMIVLAFYNYPYV